eukprot:8006075-Pyramimonas_sp.AAC.3
MPCGSAPTRETIGYTRNAQGWLAGLSTRMLQGSAKPTLRVAGLSNGSSVCETGSAARGEWWKSLSWLLLAPGVQVPHVGQVQTAPDRGGGEEAPRGGGCGDGRVGGRAGAPPQGGGGGEGADRGAIGVAVAGVRGW